MNLLIAENLEAIQAIARVFGVARLEVFGSVSTPGWNPVESDVDFLVTYPPDYDFGPWLGRFFELKERLEGILDRPVDLVQERAVENPYFRRMIDATRQPVYRDGAAEAAAGEERKPAAEESMDPDRLTTLGLLHGIAQAIDAIERNTAAMSRPDFEQDAFGRAASEGCVTRVGTALLRLERKDPATAARLTNPRRFIRLRHRLIHEYDKLDHDRVWVTIREHLPRLRAEVGGLLEHASAVAG